MGKIKKVLKLFSYALLYLLVSIGTAYGVITISVNNASREQNSGGSAESSIPEQITNIVNGIMNSSAITADFDIAVNSPSENVIIRISNAQVDLSNGVNNVAVSTDIEVELLSKAQTIDMNLTYMNDNLYVEGLNNKFCLTTTNIMDSVTEIFDIAGIEMPDMGGFDLGALDFNSILGMLSNFTETKTEDEITLDIQIPVIGGVATLTCDTNYKLKAISIPSLEIEGIEIVVNGNIDYPEKIIIDEKNDEDFINVSVVFDLAKEFLSYFSTPIMSLDLNVNYSGLDFNGTLTLDMQNFDFMVSTNIKGYNVNVIFANETVYLEFENLYAKFSLDDLDKLNSLLNRFDIDIPVEMINNTLSAVKENGITSILGMLTDTNESVNIQDIDLQVLQSIKTFDNHTLITLKDIGQIDVTAVDGVFESLSFEGFGMSASLMATQINKIELKQSEENYIDLAYLIPIANSALDIVSSETICANIEVKVGDITIPANVVYSNQNGLYLNLFAKYEQYELNVYYFDQTIFVECGNIKFKANVKNLPEIANKLLSVLNLDVKTEISDEDKEQAISSALSILDEKKYPLLIKEFLSVDDCL